MTPPPPDLLIAPPGSDDRTAWQALWDANNGGTSPAAVSAETWRRLLDPAAPVHGFLARRNGRAAGLLHYILHPVTGHIAPVCYMQDVFVAPDARRRGIARALVAALENTAQAQGWARIYWFAENGNTAAQALYRSLGVRLDFSLHVLPLAQ